MIARTLEHLPKDKPRYVMGVGYPDEIEEYARMGVDMMDCVLPTRAGRHGTVVYVGGQRINIKKKEYAEDQGPVDATVRVHGVPRGTRGLICGILFASGEPLSAVLNSCAQYRVLSGYDGAGCGGILVAGVDGSGAGLADSVRSLCGCQGQTQGSLRRMTKRE